MAGRTITQRIGLEGGAEIRSQLEAIGKAGQDAFKKFQDATNATAVMQSFGSTLDTVKKRAAEIGAAARDVGEKFNNLSNSVRTSATRISVFAVGVAAAVGGFVAFVKGAADAGDEIAKTAAALGLSTKAYQELGFAASQAGVNQEQFSKAQGRLARSIEQARQGDRQFANQQTALRRDLALGRISFDQYAEKLKDVNFQQTQSFNVFDRMGVQIAKNKDGTDNLEETELRLADAFSKSNDSVKKTAITQKIFGRGMVRMVGFLNQGRVAIEAQRKESQRLGLVIGGDVLNRQQELNDSFDKLGTAVRSTRLNLAGVFTPTMTRVIDAIVEAMARWRAQLIVVATDLANKLVPIVDDLIALLQGRDQDVQNSFILQARDAVIAFGAAVQNAVTNIVVPALQGLLKTLQFVAEAINGLFGTNFTGGQIAAALVITKLIGLFGVLSGAVQLAVSVVGLLVATFGGVPIILAAIAAAVALFVLNVVGGVQGIQAAWTAAWTAIEAFVQGIFDGITSAVQAVANGIVSAFQGAVDSIAGFFGSLASTVLAVLDRIVSAAKAVGSAVASAFSGKADGGPAFARGGPVHGAGTSRSDSIWARLSNGEFVQKTAAVRKYGLDFMAAINSLRVPANSVRALMSGFNMGGLADSLGSALAIPHMRDGGLAVAGAAGGGGRALTFVINGQPVNGLSGTPDAISQLMKITTKNKLHSAGRKPTWFGG